MSEDAPRITRRTAATVLAGFVAACGARPHKAENAFAGFVMDVTRELVAESPEFATRAGLGADLAGPGFAARLDDRSALAVDRRRGMALRLAAQVRGFDRAALDKSDQVTFDVLDARVRLAAGGSRFNFGRFDLLDGFSPYVLNQLNSAFLVLPDFLDSRHAIKSMRDGVDYVSRMKEIPAALDAEIDRARTDADAGIAPPDFVIDRTLALLDGMLALPPAQWTYVTALRRKLEAVYGPLDPAAPAPAKTRPQDLAQARALLAQAEAIVGQKIYPAHQRTAAFLRSIRARAPHDAGVMRLPDGEAYYKAALAQQTTTDLDPRRVHELGRARVAALETMLDGALRVQAMTEGTVGQRLSQLTADPRFQYPPTDEGRAALIADVQARVARIMQLAPQAFATLPKAKLEVRRVPPLLEASQSGAYYEAPALDGSQPGVYYVNLRNLAEMTKIDLPTQDFHEAVPGHHFQVALALEQTELPVLRRVAGFNAFAEGWALYAEQLADELGLYESDPIGRIGYLRWQLWRAARLVVDTGLHALGWSREEAIAYLQNVTGDAPGVVVSEVERYAVWPGQACGYEIGRMEIERLRERARRGLGPKFELRKFHDAILLGGDMPLDVLQTVVDRWIERSGGRVPK